MEKRPPTIPGFVLKNLLEKNNKAVAHAAKDLKLSRQILHKILIGTSPVTPDIAIRLGYYLEIDPEVWYKMQCSYDLYQAKLKFKMKIEPLNLRKKSNARNTGRKETEAT